MADYKIESQYGVELANKMQAGDMASGSDGSLWKKNEDGSITVMKDGVERNGVVGTPKPVTPQYQYVPVQKKTEISNAQPWMNDPNTGKSSVAAPQAANTQYVLQKVKVTPTAQPWMADPNTGKSSVAAPQAGQTRIEEAKKNAATQDLINMTTAFTESLTPKAKENNEKLANGTMKAAKENTTAQPWTAAAHAAQNRAERAKNLSESEFGRSSAIVTEYGTYENYLNNVRPDTKASRDIRKNVLSTAIDTLQRDMMAAQERVQNSTDEDMAAAYQNWQNAKQKWQAARDELAEITAAENKEKAGDWYAQQERKIAQAGAYAPWDNQLQAALTRYVDLESETPESYAARNQSGMTLEQERQALMDTIQRFVPSTNEVRDLLEYERQQQNAAQYDRITSDVENRVRDANWLGKAGYTLLSPVESLASGAGIISAAVQNAVHKMRGSDAPVDYKAPGMLSYGVNNAIRSTAQENMGNFGKFAYNTATSMLDSLAVMGLGLAGMPAAASLLGGSAATSAMVEAKDRGLTDSQAFGLGVLNGVAEGLFEEVSLEKLISLERPDTIRAAIGNILKQSFTEGSEEVATTLANTLTDAIIGGDLSEYNVNRRRYAETMSPEEAEHAAAMDWLHGVTMDFIGGAVSGALFGAGSNVLTNLGNTGSRQSAQQAVQNNEQTTPQSAQPMQNTERQIAMQDAQQTPVDNAIQAALRGEQMQEQTQQAQPETALDRAVMGAMRQNVQEAPAQQNNVQPTDSTGAAPYGFDPLSNASNQYGAIPPGENPARVVDIPVSMDGQTRVGRYARTIAEAPITTQQALSTIEQLVAQNRLSHEIYSDDAALSDAAVNIQSQILDGRDIESIRANFIKDVAAKKSGKEMGAIGSLLLEEAVTSNNGAATYDMIEAMNDFYTNAGQTLQSARILKNLTPGARAQYIMRSVDKLNEAIKAKANGKYGQEVTLDRSLVQEYLDATTDKARNDTVTKMQKSIADQVPSTIKELWDATRYVNMLGNLKTQVRNVAGNVGMQVLREAANVNRTAIENIAYLASGKRTERRSAIAPGRARMKAAAATFNQFADVVMGDAKYKETSGNNDFLQGVEEIRGKQTFTNTKSNVYNKTLGRFMQAYSNVTGKLMNEIGDQPFSKFGFSRSLAGWMKAKGITAEQWSDQNWQNNNAQLVDSGIEYAIKEAQEATFRDNNGFSSWISQAGRKKSDPKWLNVLGEGLLPFRKTPANVLVRMEQYSPLGMVNAAIDAVKTRNGTATSADVINAMAKSLTGTTLVAVGMALANSGHLRGAVDDQDELEGQQNYSIVVGDKSYTIDWANPSAWPILLGAQLMQAMGENGLSYSDIEGALTSLTEPLIEMSFLSSVKDTLDSVIDVSTGEASGGQLVVNLALNYLTQGLTNSIVGQADQASQTVSMQTYVDPNSDVPVWLQKTLGKISRKVPGWDYQQIPYVDRWGRTESTGNVGERLFNSFLNPGYSSTINRTAVDEEIRRLKEVTGTDYAPDFAKKTVTVSENGVSRNVKLDEDQYNQYRTMLGITDYSLRDALIKDEAYGKLPDSILGKAMSKAKEYANAVAKQSLDIGYTPEKWITDLKDASQEDVVKAILSSAIDSVGGIADTAKMQEYSTAYSGSKYGNVSGDIIQMAKEKAEAFENLSAKESLGFTVDKSGYDDLSAMSSAERADYFVQKAIESANNSNGYLPDNQKAGYDAAVKALNGAQFTGISDNVKESAIKAANTYYKALALSDYGAKLSEDNQKLDGLSTDDLAKHFFDKAVGDMYKDTNNNGEKWDEIQTAYNNKEINDAVVFATLPDKAADAYMKWGKEAGVTASQWLDALSYHNSAAGKDEINEDGKTTKSAEDKMREYVDSQDGLTQVQKDAIYRGFYSDGTANYKWLSKSLSEGTITADEAKKQLTPTYQTGWSQNVKSTGVSMKDYIDAVVLYEDAPSEEERKTMGYKEKWTWYVNELNKTDMTAEQKYAIVVSMNDYAESTKKKIKATLK